jgi:ABC-type dipeptide/oligopeptide/nickel transport system permease subunit
LSGARFTGFAVGSAILVALAVLALVGPVLPLADPLEQDLLAALAPPSAVRPFGADHLGRDMLARAVHAAPRSLGLALLCVGVSAGLGIAAGLTAAMGGRFADACLMRLADLALAFPGLLVALLLAGLMGGGLVPMAIGIQASLWPQFARMARAAAGVALAAPHVEAAFLAGFGQIHVVRRHLLSPVLRQTLPLAALGLGSAILSIASLGFLGLGLQPPVPEWGAMIGELAPHVAEAPIQMVLPCALVTASVLGFTLAGEGLAARLSGGKA